jgi:SP family myo-inositol transporter-like MFS transporter 13
MSKHILNITVLSAETETAHFETVGTLDSIEQTDSGYFVWLVAAAASIAGGLFGYDTGIISAVLVNLGTDLDHRLMTSSEKEAITSLCSAGAFFGAIAAGLTADKFGRKTSVYVGCVLFTVGAVLQASAYTLAQMCAGRLVVGLGVGSAAM